VIRIYLVVGGGKQAADTSVSYTLPVTPQSIKLDVAQRTEEFPLRFGSVIFPKGVSPQGVAFDAFFPGPNMIDDDIVFKTGGGAGWTPDKWVAQIRQWMIDRPDMALTVTETPIKMPVFIESFSPEWSGGFGDTNYSITFREFKLTEIRPWGAKATEGQSLKKRAPLTKPATYVTKPGDTLMLISRKATGDATRWREVLALNKVLIPNPTSVGVGLTLRVPRG